MNACVKRLRERRTGLNTKGEWEFLEMEIRTFLYELYTLSHQPRRALRHAFAFIDEALLQGRYSICDGILEMAELDKLDMTTATGLLAITLQAKQQLKNRATYYSRVETWLRKDKPEEVAAILEGLR